MNNTGQLTDRAIQRMAIGKTLADGRTGLRVRRSKTHRLFYYRFRNEQNELKQLKLLPYAFDGVPGITLMQARQALKRIKGGESHKHVLHSLNPSKHTASDPVASECTLNDLIKHYGKAHLDKNRNSVNAKKALDMLKRCAGDFIGQKPATEITVNDILNLVHAEIEKGNNAQAGYLLEELRAVFQHAVPKLLPIEFVNPAMIAKPHINAKLLKGKKGTRYLSDEEIPLFVNWLTDPEHFSINTRRIQQLTLMLGTRPGEARNLEWSDIKNGVWHLTEEKTKTGQPRQIILPNQVKKWLNKERTYTPDTRYFCESRTFEPVRSNAVAQTYIKLIKNKAMLDIPKFKPHDLRRTVRTQLSTLCSTEIAELAIGHAKKGMQGVYDMEQHKEEIGQVLQLWCNKLEKLAPNIFK